MITRPSKNEVSQFLSVAERSNCILCAEIYS
jgi:hypothetical protein